MATETPPTADNTRRGFITRAAGVVGAVAASQLVIPSQASRLLDPSSMSPLQRAALIEVHRRGLSLPGMAIRHAIEPEKLVTFADLRIQTKDQTLVPFVANAVQTAYLDIIWPTWREPTPGPMPRGVRDIILKSRQFGFSTLIAALFFIDTLNNPDTRTVVVAHQADAAENLFQIVHRFWRYLPEHKRPKTENRSRHLLTFPDRGSEYLVFTAGSSSGAGASYTIHNLHCSEAALYRGKEFWTTILQAVPLGQGNVFIESTARGESGTGADYCNMYREAAGLIDPPEDRDRIPYTARFYAWWEHSEYEIAPGPTFARDADETTIVNKYDLDARYGHARTDRKLAWRRAKRSEPGMGSMFPQEYPGDDKEAFLVSGSRFFTDWDEARHVVFEQDVTIERHWGYFGAYDWGYGAPACFLLACVDERGRVLIVDEVYGARMTDPEQAAAVLDCLKRWHGGLDPARVPIYADPSMWAAKSDRFGQRAQNVMEFHRVGLRFVKASNDRVPGWANVRRYLHDDDRQEAADGKVLPPVPFLRVLRARCPNLIRTVSLMIHDSKKVEDADTEVEDHAWDAARYLLGSRPRPSSAVRVPSELEKPPAGQPDNRPQWVKDRYDNAKKSRGPAGKSYRHL